jgi:hypothetical protein
LVPILLLREIAGVQHSKFDPTMTGLGVRRDKAALSSG